MRLLILAAALLLLTHCRAQEPAIFNDDPMQQRALNVEESEYVLRQPTGLETVTPRVEPPNWWAGMAEPTVEVLIYRRNIARFTAAEVDHPGVSVDYVKQLENPNYLFVGLRTAGGTKPGAFDIQLSNPAGERERISYSLAAHPGGPKDGLTQEDLIYLILPDRFSNGDPENDVVPGMNDQLVNRDKFFFRHGGDIRGIRSKLDYLEDLGVTALWINPLMENDQPYASYHGYAVTDHYKIDARFGTNEDYRVLVKEAGERGIKIVMDVIFNHVGDEHWFIRDLPSTDWIHQWPEFTKTTYRATTLMDPHASDRDKKIFLDGWFDRHMPDLNQQNPHLARYLIQNSIWWTLWSGQSAFRIDTYSYSDPGFTSAWNQRMLKEFPNLGIYGETWVHGPAVQAYFAGGRGIHQDFDTHLPGVTDFQLYYAVHEALAQDPGWTEGVLRLYYTLAQDYLYRDPTRNVLFLDNHDLGRLASVMNGDLLKIKSGLALLMTLRGIPMLYYGTELGLQGTGGAFGEGGRVDFPGGFPADPENLFDPSQQDSTQRALYDYVKALGNFRKSSTALRSGDFLHFVPNDGVYVYFRRSAEETVMVVFNANSTDRSNLDLSPYAEVLAGFTRGKAIGRSAPDLLTLDGLSLAAKEVLILHLE